MTVLETYWQIRDITRAVCFVSLFGLNCDVLKSRSKGRHLPINRGRDSKVNIWYTERVFIVR
jgi:hypothetical protein